MEKSWTKIMTCCSADRVLLQFLRLCTIYLLSHLVLTWVKPGYCWLAQQNTLIQESCESSALIGHETCRRQDFKCCSQSQRWTAVSSPLDDSFLVMAGECCLVAALALSDINLIHLTHSHPSTLSWLCLGASY